MEYRWNEEKDRWLLAKRGVSFEDLIQALEEGALLSEREHPDPKRTHQRILWVLYQGQVWVLPYVLEDGCRFLKTAFPSRQATKHSRKEIA